MLISGFGNFWVDTGEKNLGLDPLKLPLPPGALWGTLQNPAFASPHPTLCFLCRDNAKGLCAHNFCACVVLLQYLLAWPRV